MADDNKTRATYYRRLQKLKTRVDEHGKNPMTYDEAITHQESLDANMAKLEEVQLRLLAKCVDSGAIETQEDAFEPMFDAYMATKSILRGIISKLTKPAPVTTTSSPREFS